MARKARHIRISAYHRRRSTQQPSHRSCRLSRRNPSGDLLPLRERQCQSRTPCLRGPIFRTCRLRDASTWRVLLGRYRTRWRRPERSLAERHALSCLNRARALAALRLAEIALARIGPLAPIAIKDIAEFIKHFCSNPNPPAGKRFARGSRRAFLFPSNTHRSNFEQVRTFNFRFRHGLEYYGRLLKTRCLYRTKKLQFRLSSLAGEGHGRCRA